MAAGGSDILGTIKENLLVCDICLEEFHSPSRLPRCLPCLHCFCEDCVESLTKANHIRCPKCRKDFLVEGPFPVDPTRMALLGLQESSRIPKSVVCGSCEEGGDAVSHCQECMESLCGNCTFAHRKLKLFKTHTLVSLSEAAGSSSKPAGKSQTPERPVHHGGRKLPFECPVFLFDARRCNRMSSVSADGTTLFNIPCEKGRDQKRFRMLKVNGTCTTEAVPDTSCYWQVRLTGKDCSYRFDYCTYDIGVASEEALAKHDDWKLKSNRDDLKYIRVEVSNDEVTADLYLSKKSSDAHLLEWSGNLDCPIGFLLDRPNGRLHVIDIYDTQAIGRGVIDMSKPMWPVVCVDPEGDSSVSLELNCGESMEMSSDLVDLLVSLLQKKYKKPSPVADLPL